MDNETEYVSTLNEQEKIAIELAKSALGSSFALKRCIGFIEHLENKHAIADSGITEVIAKIQQCHAQPSPEVL